MLPNELRIGQRVWVEYVGTVESIHKNFVMLRMVDKEGEHQAMVPYSALQPMESEIPNGA